MSFLLCGFPVVECVYCLACARWAWKRCLRTAGHDSEHWSVASTEDFESVPRLCRIILANYEDDLEHPLWSRPGGYDIDPQFVIRRKQYKDTGGRCTPYLIFLDHAHNDIVLALRGLNLAKESDYALMLDNRLGKTPYDGGFVHNGLLRAAAWVLDAESEVLSEMVVKYPSYTLTFAGHSLGSGVAAMLTMLVVQNREGLGNVAREKVRCFAMAPARCMSLNLAVKYADVINSVILQDDFLPRTATPLEDIFKSIFCLPCILCLRCMRDTFIPEEKMFRDPRRLYAPGRLYHIVERKPFRCKRFPPEVRTAVPVDGRFEHIVLSCNATSDHAIIWVEREAQRALDLMLEKERNMEVPPQQKMQRQATLIAEHNNEHKAALQRAVTLAVPDAFAPSYGSFDECSGDGGQDSTVPKKSRQETWHHLINRLFEKDKYENDNMKKTDKLRVAAQIRISFIV